MEGLCRAEEEEGGCRGTIPTTTVFKELLMRLWRGEGTYFGDGRCHCFYCYFCRCHYHRNSRGPSSLPNWYDSSNDIIRDISNMVEFGERDDDQLLKMLMLQIQLRMIAIARQYHRSCLFMSLCLCPQTKNTNKEQRYFFDGKWGDTCKITAIANITRAR